MNRGGTEIVESGLDMPVVVIGGALTKTKSDRLVGEWRISELRWCHDVVGGGGEVVVWREERGERDQYLIFH